MQKLFVHMAECDEVYDTEQLREPAPIGAIDKCSPFGVFVPVFDQFDWHQYYLRFIFCYSSYHASVAGLAAVERHSTGLARVDVI